MTMYDVICDLMFSLACHVISRFNKRIIYLLTCTI